MKSVAMIIPTPSKAEITGKRNFSETIEIENEEQEATKRPRVDSDKEMIEVENKKIKEKEKSQGLVFQIQECNFAKVQEVGSSDRYKSINDLHTRYGHDNKFSSEKYLNLFPKVRDISDKEV